MPNGFVTFLSFRPFTTFWNSFGTEPGLGCIIWHMTSVVPRSVSVQAVRYPWDWQNGDSPRQPPGQAYVLPTLCGDHPSAGQRPSTSTFHRLHQLSESERWADGSSARARPPLQPGLADRQGLLPERRAVLGGPTEQVLRVRGGD